MTKMNLSRLIQMKANGDKIAMLTCYDATFAAMLSQQSVDVLLIGDSLGNVIQGQDSTLPVTIEHIRYHTECVSRGNESAFVIADMPFMTYATPEQALENAATLIRAGAQMVKLEGGVHLCDTIHKLSMANIPVCGHLGLMPQAINMLGRYSVQGKEADSAEKILKDAQSLQEAGAKMLVLECVPAMLAADISHSLQIPTIGIGAGPGCDGQVLVLHDMLGLSRRTPKFVKNYLADADIDSISEAVAAYVSEVKNKSFPAEKHCYIL